MELMKDPSAMLKSVLKPGELKKEQIKKIIDNVPVPEIDTKIGKSIELTGRTIYPVIQSYVTKSQDFVAVEVFPVALVIQELDSEYVISIIDEEINPEKFIKMVSSQNSNEKV